MPETPDWIIQPAPCPRCPAPWHALPHGDCETSALAPRLHIPLLRWEGDDN